MNHGQILMEVRCDYQYSRRILGLNEYAEFEICCFCGYNRPVCATNKIKYYNQCYFQNLQRYYIGSEGQIEAEECSPQHVSTPRCPDCCECPQIGNLVCGTNGEFYRNICAFDCAWKYWKAIGLTFQRIPCPKEPRTTIPPTTTTSGSIEKNLTQMESTGHGRLAKTLDTVPPIIPNPPPLENQDNEVPPKSKIKAKLKAYFDLIIFE